MKEIWQNIARNSYPLALAAVPVLCSYAVRAGSTQPPTIILWPLALALATGTASLLFFWVVLRDLEKAAIICSSIFISLFVSLYMIFVEALCALVGVKTTALFSLPVLISVSALVLIAGIFVVARNLSSRVSTVLRPLSWYFFFLQLIAIGMLAVRFAFNLQKTSLYPQPMEGIKTAFAGSETNKPDFYYIILDGYANPRTYKERYGYDNSPFIKSLSDSGFKLVPDSFSNYAFTELSLCSSLNMTYLDKVPQALGKNSTDVTIPCWYIEDNQIIKVLRQKGYQFINLGGAYGPTTWNLFAQKNIPGGPFDMFAMDLWQTSLLSIIETATHARLSCNYYRWSIENIFRNIEESASIPGPKFVFAHVMVPHPPFAFNAQGGDSHVPIMAFSWGKPGAKLYVEQSQYTEKSILKVLENLVKHVKKDSIIVVQSDHGPEFDQAETDDTSVFRYHRMLIFNCFKVPDNIKLPEQLSPVNTFRILFNQTLGKVFPIQENRAYLSSPATPYQFIETTKLYKTEEQTKRLEHH